MDKKRETKKITTKKQDLPKTEVETDNKVILKKEEEKTIVEEKEFIDIDVHKMAYTSFLLFYSFLKASKNGRERQGGWMSNDLRIKQMGKSFLMKYKGEEFEINEDSCIDISDIILNYITV